MTTSSVDYRKDAINGVRGTGKTTRLLKAMPRDGLYIVQNSSVIAYFQNYMFQIGRHGWVTFTSISDREFTAGKRFSAIGIDHCVLDTWSVDQRQYWKKIITVSSSITLTNDEEGDVKLEVLKTWH